MENKKYEWRLAFILGSGKEVLAYYRGEEDNSDAVARKILNGRIDEFIGFSDKKRTKNIFIRLGEVAAVSISPASVPLEGEQI